MKKQKTNKVKTVVYLIHFILIDIWARNGVLHIFSPKSPNRGLDLWICPDDFEPETQLILPKQGPFFFPESPSSQLLNAWSKSKSFPEMLAKLFFLRVVSFQWVIVPLPNERLQYVFPDAIHTNTHLKQQKTLYRIGRPILTCLLHLPIYCFLRQIHVGTMDYMGGSHESYRRT